MSPSRTSQASAIAENCPRVSAEANSPTRAFRRQTVYALRQAPPDWLHEAVKRLQSFESLRENWDSYGAAPIDLDSISGGIALLSRLAMYECVEKPAIGATPDGHVGFSWDEGAWSLDAEVLPTGHVQYVYLDEDDSANDREATALEWVDLLELLTHWS